MNEQELKKSLNEDRLEIPSISSDLNSKLSNFVLENKDKDFVDDLHSVSRLGYYLAVAAIVLVACAWIVISTSNKETFENKKPEVNYENIFVNAKLPEIKLPAIKTPRIDLVIPDKASRAIVAFLNDKNNNPYEQEIQSIAKLSKRIAANFSDELMLDQFGKLGSRTWKISKDQ